MPAKRVQLSARAKPSRAKPSRSSGKSSAKKSTRRGSDDSLTRDRLLDAAGKLMREEGYGAVTTRSIGAKAGVHAQLVHYYFSDMDELFLELWRRFTSHSLARHAQAFLSSNPARTVWEQDVEPNDASLLAELMALARHRKSLAREIADTVGKIRAMQAGALAGCMEHGGLKELFGSPEVFALCMVGLARILVVEGELGIKSGHAEARDRIARWLEKLGKPKAAIT
jgi:AcrR family transcriptional regulator